MVSSMNFDPTADHAPITPATRASRAEGFEPSALESRRLTTEDTVVTEKTVHPVWKRSSAFVSVIPVSSVRCSFSLGNLIGPTLARYWWTPMRTRG